MDSGERAIIIALLLGLFGSIKGFDKELEKDTILGLANTDSSFLVERRNEFIHAKISLRQTVVGLIS